MIFIEILRRIKFQPLLRKLKLAPSYLHIFLNFPLLVAKRTVLRILNQRGEEETENAQKCRQFFDHTATQWSSSSHVFTIPESTNLR